jgi:hypothetical protein
MVSRAAKQVKDGLKRRMERLSEINSRGKSGRIENTDDNSNDNNSSISPFNPIKELFKGGENNGKQSGEGDRTNKSRDSKSRSSSFDVTREYVQGRKATARAERGTKLPPETDTNSISDGIFDNRSETSTESDARQAEAISHELVRWQSRETDNDDNISEITVDFNHDGRRFYNSESAGISDNRSESWESDERPSTSDYATHLESDATSETSETSASDATSETSKTSEPKENERKRQAFTDALLQSNSNGNDAVMRMFVLQELAGEMQSDLGSLSPKPKE